MTAIQERHPGVPLSRACDALGFPRATMYRLRRPPSARVARRAPSPPRRLTDAEREQVLGVLHEPEFADQPPREVFATLLSRGTYVASVRTMYRLLADQGEVRERRALRRAMKHPKPSLVATAPNQVWTWDITKLRTTTPGAFLSLYVVIDLFSRMVVGWMLAVGESAALAKQLFDETIEKHRVQPGTLVVHADRGSPMRSTGLADLLAVLGVERSFSRPRVSDDNAFTEAQFKTMKYQPDYPGRFASLVEARGWCEHFFAWYCNHHHHESLALFTPADVFEGRVEAVAETRQRALDGAYAAHPERFPNGRPVVRRPPAEVAINPLPPAAADVGHQGAPQADGRAEAALDRTSGADGDPRGEALTRPAAGGAQPRGSTTPNVVHASRRAELHHAACS